MTGINFEWGPCALRHWIQSSMEAILAFHPAVSTEWLAGWQFTAYYDVCARPPLVPSMYVKFSQKPRVCRKHLNQTALSGQDKKKQTKVFAILDSQHTQKRTSPSPITFAFSRDHGGLLHTIINSGHMSPLPTRVRCAKWHIRPWVKMLSLANDFLQRTLMFQIIFY